MKALTIDELSPGTEVWYEVHVAYGWHAVYRHSIYRKTTVQRITPKRTKAVLENGIEVKADPYGGMSKKLYRWDPEMERETALAERFRKMQGFLNTVRDADLHVLANIPDEKTGEAEECLERLTKILCGKRAES